jgi:release factor glutamine methyltransferase
MAKNVNDWLKHLSREISPLSESANLDAQVLLAHVVERPRSWILAHPEAVLTDDNEDELQKSIDRLKSGVPLPYVLGHWEFFGLDITLSPVTLIPRPETELIVETSLDWLNKRPEKKKVADVGTGSGCISVALAVNKPDLWIVATDNSNAALSIAAENANKHGVNEIISFINCNLLDPLYAKFDLICANLPYITKEEMEHLEVAQCEPYHALYGGLDGLDYIRALLNTAPRFLVRQSCLLLEIGERQGERVFQLAQQKFSRRNITILKDLAGKDRLLQVIANG